MFNDNTVREYLATNVHGDINNIKLQLCYVNMDIYFMLQHPLFMSHTVYNTRANRNKGLVLQSYGVLCKKNDTWLEL